VGVRLVERLLVTGNYRRRLLRGGTAMKGTAAGKTEVWTTARGVPSYW